jgi:hypothetical protein
MDEGKDSPSCSGSPERAPPLCLEAPVIQEGGLGQWVTQVYLAKLAQETSSQDQTFVLGSFFFHLRNTLGKLIKYRPF